MERVSRVRHQPPGPPVVVTPYRSGVESRARARRLRVHPNLDLTLYPADERFVPAQENAPVRPDRGTLLAGGIHGAAPPLSGPSGGTVSAPGSGGIGVGSSVGTGVAVGQGVGVGDGSSVGMGEAVGNGVGVDSGASCTRSSSIAHPATPRDGGKSPLVSSRKRSQTTCL